MKIIYLCDTYKKFEYFIQYIRYTKHILLLEKASIQDNFLWRPSEFNIFQVLIVLEIKIKVQRNQN